MNSQCWRHRPARCKAPQNCSKTCGPAKANGTGDEINEQKPGALAGCRQPQKFTLPARNIRLEHDPEKWIPVFGKDHAPSKSYRAQSIQPETIAL
jgi:hypothetical protein